MVIMGRLGDFIQRPRKIAAFRVKNNNNATSTKCQLVKITFPNIEGNTSKTH